METLNLESVLCWRDRRGVMRDVSSVEKDWSWKVVDRPQRYVAKTDDGIPRLFTVVHLIVRRLHL